MHSTEVSSYGVGYAVLGVSLVLESVAFAGGILATVALGLTQATGSRWPDAIASGLIGIALIAAAVALTQQNRSLLTGQGVPPSVLERMRTAIAAQPGVVDVPDLIGVGIGPATLVVDGDVTFEDALTVPEVETVLSTVIEELRSRWPEVRYVYLNPVGARRSRDRSDLR
jgi:divalent metal cation (Fe/Co/Zn/Cd) transporter